MRVDYAGRHPVPRPAQSDQEGHGMTTTRKRLAEGARITTVARGGSYRGQVLPTDRRYTDPIVLSECRHQHRTERGALACASAMREALRNP